MCSIVLFYAFNTMEFVSDLENPLGVNNKVAWKS